MGVRPCCRLWQLVFIWLSFAGRKDRRLQWTQCPGLAAWPSGNETLPSVSSKPTFASSVVRSPGCPTTKNTSGGHEHRPRNGKCLPLPRILQSVHSASQEDAEPRPVRTALSARFAPDNIGHDRSLPTDVFGTKKSRHNYRVWMADSVITGEH